MPSQRVGPAARFGERPDHPHLLDGPVANQLASTPSATPNDRLDIARPSRGRPTASQDPLPSANGQTDQSSALERHRRRLVELQAEYVAWHDALPDSLRDS